MVPGGPRRPEALEASAVALGRLMASFRVAVRRRLEPEGLTLPQVMLLRMLERHPGLTATEVAAEMSLSPAAITGLINKLEDDGLVERRRERDDRRVVRLILTDRARAATKAMRQSFQASMQHTLQPLSDEELETLARLVEKALAGSARPGTATQRAGAGSRRLRPLDRPLRVARTTGPRAARGRRERAPASSRRRGARGE